MQVAPWISYQVYYTNSEIRAYISNAKNHTEIMLEDISAKLWDLIASGKSKNDILKFLKENDADENDLNLFIEDLQIQDLLLKNDYQKSQTSNFAPITYDKERLKQQLEYFDALEEWLTKNHLLSGLMMELTYRCNEKCLHCYNDKDNFIDEIKFDDIKSVIDDAKKIGVTTITLSGGECTLAKDFLKICKYIREKNIKLCIFTNGQTFYDNPELLNEVLKLYPTRISFSLYSMNPDIHDKITGIKGSHAKTLAMIEKLKQINIDIEIKSFLTKFNIDNFEDIVNYANKNSMAINVDSVFLYNPARNNYDVQATEEQLLKFYSLRDKVLNYVPAIGDLEFNEKYYNMSLCKGGHSQLAINPLLELYPCVAFKYKLGNLKQTSLEKIFYDKSPDSPINKIKQYKRKDLTECHKEEYCKYCSYCSAKASAENGFLKKSKICCTHAKALMTAKKETKI